MKNVEIKNNWNEITLSDYCRLAAIEGEEHRSSIEKRCKVIEVLSSMTFKEIVNLDQDSFGKLVDKISFIDGQAEAYKEEFFEIDGVKYMKLHNLDKLTVGESISIEQLMVDYATLTNGGVPKLYEILPDILAVIIRQAVKVGDVYEIEPFDADTVPARKEMFLNNLTVPFFSASAKDISTGALKLEKIIQRCLTPEQLQMLRAKK